MPDSPAASAEPSPPAYPAHEGLPVAWDPWEEAIPATHIEHLCERCKYTGLPLLTYGVTGGYRRLVAFRCPACATQQVYDMHAGPDGRDFVEVRASTQLDLFAL